MATEAPAWLQDENGGGAAAAAAAPASSSTDAAAAASGTGGGGGLEPMSTTTAPPAAASTTITTTSPAASTNNAEANNTEEDDPDLPGVILTMRLANMGVAVALIVISIITMVGLPSASAFILAIYACCGGLLICCLETQLKFLRVMIAINFGFLFNSFWRFVFYVLLGSIAWSFGKLMGQIVACCLVGVACFNTYVLCRYPSYRKMREKIASEEDKRIEARISKQVKRQAAASIMGK